MRKQILRAAREEFIVNGFRDASLRTIARESGISVSNIYNHFEHKDSLFRAVLEPLLLSFDAMLEDHNSEENMDMYVHEIDRYRDTTVASLSELVRQYRMELKLLLFRSAGSSLEHFNQELVDRQCRVGEEYLSRIKQRYPTFSRDVSPLFIRMLSTWWIVLLSEIVSNEHLGIEELERGLSEYLLFSTAGWKALMKY